ncbi:ABC transporter substrate-binding protein [Vulcanisaeta distributa]|uniref:Periplasmic binding protein n=1 Tax=Vulcanisaeta distributa (strain DSM 14429 / JCM 11212 / NBRC 100878 / IC-017) TaxID=572478 RepID=E1QTW1_VULDI|nr:ABC transporter substrate-binding protein [Vulcanisaeta distributa]ADN51028.1 periplasmic binding protein [Vulcanisaeta distributa DSM 14429]
MLLTKALDGTPRRIVSLNPSITEFLFIIGAGNRVIGTDVWSYRPREAMKTVKIGSFTSADIETIKRLSPDLIILSYPVQRHLVEPLSGIAPVLAVPMPVNLNAIISSFEMIGKLLDLDEEAQRVMGIYMDLLKHSIDVENVIVVLSLGDYVIPCETSYIASTLERVGIKYVRGLKCVELITNKDGALNIINRVNPQLVIYEGKTKDYRPQETNWINRPTIHTPNDVLAHFGPSLPLDIQLLINTIKNKEKFVKNTSSIVRPSLGDPWYKPYL